MRGYNLIIDVKTRLATVFEVWFCGYRDNREVQREIYFGYVDCCSGEGDPQKRHTFTNRVEGKGFYWKDDTGTEILNFYPSVIYSTFVELSDPRGGITISAPSDYVKLSDILYVYSRVECEYSGTFVLEVVDLFGVKNVGVRLGFDEHDELDYRMYTAEGEITGTIASFESMTDYGTKVPEVMSSHGETVKSKGARPVYRPRHLYPSMTADEVKKKLSEEIKPFSGESIMPGANKMELSDYLARANNSPSVMTTAARSGSTLLIRSISSDGATRVNPSGIPRNTRHSNPRTNLSCSATFTAAATTPDAPLLLSTSQTA